MNGGPPNIVVPAALIGLPPTGATTSYRNGDDAYFKAGRPFTVRFAATVNNTVVDRLTALEWIANPTVIKPGGDGTESLTARGVWLAANDYAVNDLVQGDGAPDSLFYIAIAASGPGHGGAQEPPNAAYWVVTPWTASAANLTTPGPMTWNNAIDNSFNLAYAGRDDWRLPNLMEIMSLIKMQAPAPYIATPLITIKSGVVFYHSSTTAPWATATKLVGFSFNSGMQTEMWKADSHYVLPVRGGILNV